MRAMRLSHGDRFAASGGLGLTSRQPDLITNSVNTQRPRKTWRSLIRQYSTLSLLRPVMYQPMGIKAITSTAISQCSSLETIPYSCWVLRMFTAALADLAQAPAACQPVWSPGKHNDKKTQDSDGGF